MNETMDQLLQVLAFRGDSLVQLVMVSTILGGFSISGVLTLLSSRHAHHLRPALFCSFSTASALSILATTISVIILPHMGEAGNHRSPRKILGQLRLDRVALYTDLAGFVLLMGSLGGLGFLVLRRLGLISAAVVLSTAIAFFVCAMYLNQVLLPGP
jgi:hypothetical protein